MLTNVFRKLVAYEPAFAAGTVQAVLALLVALGHHFSAAQTGAIEAIAAAFLGLVTAGAVNKATPAVYTGLLTAVGTLLIAFGVPHVNSGEVSAANALVAVLMASLLREKVSPIAAAKSAPAHAGTP